MKEEQKYHGSKTRNYFTAYLLASIRGKRLRYLEKQQKILFAEERIYRYGYFARGKAGIGAERATAHGRSTGDLSRME